MILRSSRFVPFGANLTHFGLKSAIPVAISMKPGRFHFFKNDQDILTPNKMQMH